ncbi:MAG: hypothetical protein ACO3FE_05775, partial [Planctomycetaceae bacterium]
WGDIEPCPIVQFSTESIHAADDSRPLLQKFTDSQFLADFRQLSQETTRGCIVLERPDLLAQLVDKHSAKDATARKTAMSELKSMVPRTSQYHPGHEIPEKNLYYRLAKRFLFNDFGVYDGHDHSRSAAPFLLDQASQEVEHQEPETIGAVSETGSGEI